MTSIGAKVKVISAWHDDTHTIAEKDTSMSSEGISIPRRSERMGSYEDFNTLHRLLWHA